MNTTQKIAAALTLATAFGSNALACGSAPTLEDKSQPITAGIDPTNGKLYLSQGIWSISATGPNNTLETTNSMKCIQRPEVYRAAEAQMNKLAKDVCNPNKDVSVQSAEGSATITKPAMNQFCSSLGSTAEVIHAAPKAP